MKDIKNFLKKKKSTNMVVKDTKIYQKMKNKSWLSIEENIEWEKRLCYNYKKLSLLRKPGCFLRVKIRNVFLLSRKLFFYFVLKFKTFVRQTKSAVIIKYGGIAYFMLNQQSSLGYKSFYVLQVDEQPSQNLGNMFLSKNT